MGSTSPVRSPLAPVPAPNPRFPCLATICPHTCTHTPPSSEVLLFNSVEVLRGASVDVKLCRLLSRTIRRTHPQPSSCPVAAILGFAIVIKEKFLICRRLWCHRRLLPLDTIPHSTCPSRRLRATCVRTFNVTFTASPALCGRRERIGCNHHNGKRLDAMLPQEERKSFSGTHWSLNLPTFEAS